MRAGQKCVAGQSPEGATADVEAGGVNPCRLKTADPRVWPEPSDDEGKKKAAPWGGLTIDEPLKKPAAQNHGRW